MSWRPLASSISRSARPHPDMAAPPTPHGIAASQHNLIPSHANNIDCRSRVVATAVQAKAPRGHGVMPSDHADSPFKELAVAEIWEGIGKTRVRQHVNPLSRENQIVTTAPDWSATFAQPQAPLVLDLGCGPGRFLLLMHQRRNKGSLNLPVLGDASQPVNYLGLEIRRALVERANEWSTRLGVSGQIQYIATNATISLGSVLHSYPGPVQLIAIQFPDPHFKKRHYKRRIFQPQMVQEVTKLLKPGGWLFLQSDVLEVAAAMRNIFEKYAGEHFTVSDLHSSQETFYEEPPLKVAAPGPDQATSQQTSSQTQGESSEAEEAEFQYPTSSSEDEAGSDSEKPGRETDDYLTLKSEWSKQGWLRENPLGVPTEREHYVLQQGLPVYRILLVKKE